MERQEIEIAILPDGRVEYTIKGVQGAACDSISALLEKLGKVERSERTADYYATETNLQVAVADN